MPTTPLLILTAATLCSWSHLDLQPKAPTPPQIPVHWDAYAQLSPTLRQTDERRLSSILANLGPVRTRLTRDEYKIDSIEEFPRAVEYSPAPAAPVPLYILPDPASIYSTLAPTAPADDQPSRLQLLRTASIPSATPASSVLAFFQKQPFETPCSLPPWPSWADARAPGSEYPLPRGLHWGAANAPGPAFNVLVRACIQDANKARFTALRLTRSLTDSVWCLLPDSGGPDPDNESFATLIFPLWETVGTLRDPAADPHHAHRPGPMSAHASSPDVEWTIGGYPGFILGAPVAVGRASAPRREHLVLPEFLASQPVPIVSIEKADTWKPFAEDYTVRLGLPGNTDRLRAACIFMTATDEQIEAVLRFFTAPQDAASPAGE